MKRLIIASSFALAGFAVSGVPVMALEMHKATLEVGKKKEKNRSYFVVKMDGKMYAMVPLDSFDKLIQAVENGSLY
jgi:hypothetical protein